MYQLKREKEQVLLDLRNTVSIEKHLRDDVSILTKQRDESEMQQQDLRAEINKLKLEIVKISGHSQSLKINYDHIQTQ